MTKKQTISLIKKVCKLFKIKLFLDENGIGKDNGLAYVEDGEIHLGKKYSSQGIMLVIFFHEFGHLQIWRKKIPNNNDVCLFTEELAAWHYGLDEYYKWVRKPVTKTQGMFIAKCLKEYAKSSTSFKHTEENLNEKYTDR